MDECQKPWRQQPLSQTLPIEPGSKERGHSTQKSALTDASSTFNPLHVPDGLRNGKLGKQCEGLNPLEIDPAVLTAAGHPPRRTSAVVAAFNKIMGGEIFAVARIKRHSDIRAYCMTCVANSAEVRRCTTFWCPFWPYRMGKNPHSPRLGKPLPHLNATTQQNGPGAETTWAADRQGQAPVERIMSDGQKKTKR
jgi:hypothetical protein